jgi:hypothetical protein
MINVRISDPLAERLVVLAERENRSLDEIVERILSAHMPNLDEQVNDALPGSLAALLHAADEANLRSATDDTADRSRDILTTDYVDYLQQKYRLDESNESGT